ncbi:MAG: hypothetical protein JSU87_05980 [Gemmatimonadota bacterium]|nr:MAG: hypothetical protein JSU87_05980 [Gemmatimonadota bacterium]
MKPNALISLLVGSGLMLSGCSGDEPVSPTDVDAGPQLVVGAPGTPVEFDVFLGGLGPGIPTNPGECIHVTGDGKTHFNHCIFLGPVGGELENPAPGAAVVILTGVQDAQGNGQIAASFTFTATWHSPSGDLTGTFEGNVQATGTFGLQSGRLHAHGTGGDFSGLQLWGDFQEPGPPPGTSLILVTGTIRGSTD